MQARKALSVHAEEAAKYDADGVDIHFFNDFAAGKNINVHLLHPSSLKTIHA